MIGNVSLLFYSDFHRETGPSHSGSPTPYQECGLCAREPEMFDAVSPTKSSSDPYTTGYRRPASVCQKIENAVLPCCQSTAVEGSSYFVWRFFIFNCRPNTVPIFPLFWWQFSENAALGKQHRPSKQPFTGLLWIFQENGLSNVIPNENRTRSLLRSFSLFLYISSCRKIPFH